VTSLSRQTGLAFRVVLIGALISSLPRVSPAQAQIPDFVSGGYSIFDETLADLTYPELEEAAKQGAVVLWPLGVMEEHGPHLPLGTDIYVSTLMMKEAARHLRSMGHSVVIAPPLYWGINETTRSFAGSLSLRPSTLKAIIEDTFQSLYEDGFRSVYMITGHGDPLHNRTILEGVAESRATTGIRGFVVMDSPTGESLSLTGEEPHVIIVEGSEYGGHFSSPYVDVHAGESETSVFWYLFSDLTRAGVIARLEPTNYGIEDLIEWVKGRDNARAKTPMGYFGNPAAADRVRGEAAFSASSLRLAEGIAAHVTGAR
jgi:creatinine amidohydrolase